MQLEINLLHKIYIVTISPLYGTASISSNTMYVILRNRTCFTVYTSQYLTLGALSTGHIALAHINELPCLYYPTTTTVTATKCRNQWVKATISLHIGQHRAIRALWPHLHPICDLSLLLNALNKWTQCALNNWSLSVPWLVFPFFTECSESCCDRTGTFLFESSSLVTIQISNPVPSFAHFSILRGSKIELAMLRKPIYTVYIYIYIFLATSFLCYRVLLWFQGPIVFKWIYWYTVWGMEVLSLYLKL